MARLDALMLAYLQMCYVNAEGMPHDHMNYFLINDFSCSYCIVLYRNTTTVSKQSEHHTLYRNTNHIPKHTETFHPADVPIFQKHLT